MLTNTSQITAGDLCPSPVTFNPLSITKQRDSLVEKGFTLLSSQGLQVLFPLPRKQQGTHILWNLDILGWIAWETQMDCSDVSKFMQLLRFTPAEYFIWRIWAFSQTHVHSKIYKYSIDQVGQFLQQTLCCPFIVITALISHHIKLWHSLRDTVELVGSCWVLLCSSSTGILLHSSWNSGTRQIFCLALSWMVSFLLKLCAGGLVGYRSTLFDEICVRCAQVVKCLVIMNQWIYI